MNQERVLGQAGPSPQEKTLRIMLLSMTVPFRDGGGLVFPIGFPGAGYRLDEWQFENYRTTLNQRLLSNATVREARRAWSAFFVLLWLVLVALFFLYFSQRGDLNEVLRHWLDILVLAPIALIAGYVFVFNFRNYKDFKRRFPDVLQIPRTAYLGRRMMGYVVARELRPIHEVLLALFVALLGGGLLYIALQESLAALLGIVALLLVATLSKACQLLAYWRFHRTHGHRPTLKDLTPIDPPLTRS